MWQREVYSTYKYLNVHYKVDGAKFFFRVKVVQHWNRFLNDDGGASILKAFLDLARQSHV